jgi:hypothetical protein
MKKIFPLLCLVAILISEAARAESQKPAAKDWMCVEDTNGQVKCAPTSWTLPPGMEALPATRARLQQSLDGAKRGHEACVAATQNEERCELGKGAQGTYSEYIAGIERAISTLK